MTKPINTIAPLSALVATLMLGTPALAQTTARPGEQLGLRYLSWAGKPAGTTNDGLRRAGASAVALPVHGQTQAASLGAAVSVASPTLARPNRYGSVSSPGLTPASAWISPRTQPAPLAAQPVLIPQVEQGPQPLQARQEPQAYSAPSQALADAPQYDPGNAVRRQDPYFGAPPEVQMAMQPTPQPVPMPPPPPIPAAVEQPADPMAPRRDALIFRMSPQAPAAPQQQTAEAASDAPRQLAQAAPVRPDAPARQGARYYSVHREAGHQPDPMTLPESVFIGGSADLAEPPPSPIVQRNINGRAQVMVPNQDPALP